MSSAPSKPFIQYVTFQTADTAQRDGLTRHYGPLLELIKAHEGGITFEGFLSADAAQTQGAQELILFETYASESVVHELHETEEFKGLLAHVTQPGTLAAPPKLDILRPILGFHTRGAAREAEVAASGRAPYALVVRFKLNSADAVPDIVGTFTEFAQYVEASEPDTLTYELLQSTKDATEFVVFERFTTEAALQEVHHKSAPLLKFRARLAEIGTIVSRDHRVYNEMRIGFWGAQ